MRDLGGASRSVATVTATDGKVKVPYNCVTTK